MITWQQELNLLNDDQLSRIAFASEDSWGMTYSAKQINGYKCCVMGKILDLGSSHESLCNYRSQLGYYTDHFSPLEAYYEFNEHKLEIIKEIQSEARKILAERRAKVGDQIHSDTPAVTLTSALVTTVKHREIKNENSY